MYVCIFNELPPFRKSLIVYMLPIEDMNERVCMYVMYVCMYVRMYVCMYVFRFSMRKKLGARKHSAISVKQTAALLWEGSIYKIKRRDVDLELVATKGYPCR